MRFAIQTSNLSKTFVYPPKLRSFFASDKSSKKTIALDSVSIAVESGKILGLLGLNGAGKTTLIKILSTLLLPSSGQALINGYDVIREEAKVRTSVGFVSGEERSFYWRLTGRQNLEFFASLHNLQPYQARKKIANLAEKLGFEEQLDQRFHAYSAGIKQRMAIARALLSNPSVLFLDEPTKNLDPLTTQDVHRIIKEQIVEKQGATVILTTHHLDEAENLSDSIAVLDRGKVRFFGSIGQLKKQLHLPEIYNMQVSNFDPHSIKSLEPLVKISFIDQKEPLDDLSLHFKSTRQGKELSIVSEHIVRSGGTILSCEKLNNSLEKIFLELTSPDCHDAYADNQESFERIEE